ncbi:MAG TPA: hypothetical protein VF074_22830 [Pyrinomonadaceae bacterium]
MKRTSLNAAVDLARTHAGRSNGALDRHHPPSALPAPGLNRPLDLEHFRLLDGDLSLPLDPHVPSNADYARVCTPAVSRAVNLLR